MATEARLHVRQPVYSEKFNIVRTIDERKKNRLERYAEAREFIREALLQIKNIHGTPILRLKEGIDNLRGIVHMFHLCSFLILLLTRDSK